jgi:hypothetical protein
MVMPISGSDINLPFCERVSNGSKVFFVPKGNKHQTPSTKSQTNSNNQNPNVKQNGFGHLKLMIGIYLRFGIWTLEFGIKV